MLFPLRYPQIERRLLRGGGRDAGGCRDVAPPCRACAVPRYCSGVAARVVARPYMVGLGKEACRGIKERCIQVGRLLGRFVEIGLCVEKPLRDELVELIERALLDIHRIRILHVADQSIDRIDGFI